MRRTIAAIAFSAAVVSVLVAPARENVGQASMPPNFVVIVTDDQRWDTIGRCKSVFDPSNMSAGSDACMPFLQQDLAANGITFSRGYVTTAICCPSRASILTGQAARHTNVLDNAGFPNFDDSSTLATWLNDAGYRTGHVGKYLNGYWLNTQPDYYIPPGWDSWRAYLEGDYIAYTLLEADPGVPPTAISYDERSSTSAAACAAGNYYMTDVLCRHAVDFLANETSTPFFLHLAPGSPHEPFTAADRWKGAFDGVTLPTYPNENQAPAPNPPRWIPMDPLDATKMNQLKLGFRRQLDMNLAVDDMIHEVFLQLSQDGRLQNTVFVFISDNGLARGEHRYDSKGCEFEECHRVPFLVACPTAVCPGASTGRVDTEHLALNIDLAPTIAELAGVTPTIPVDGTSLVPLLNGQSPSWRSSYVFEDKWPRTGTLEGVLADALDGHTYKYVEYAGGKAKELYDLTTDPWELSNLADDGGHAAIQAELDAVLALGYPPPPPPSAGPVLTITSGPSGPTSQTSASFVWTSSEAASFDCSLDGAPFESCGSGTTGSAMYDGLTEASHTFEVHGSDADGNVSPTVSRSFTVDLTPPPPPTFDGVPSDPSGSSASFSFSFSFSDAEAGVGFTCSLDGATPTTCTSPRAYSALSDGSHTFEVRAIDAAGNASDPATYTWSVTISADTSLPVVTMNAPPSDALSTGTTVRATWSGTDDVGIVRYDVLERVGTSGVPAVVQSSLATSYTRTGDPGTTYCHQVQAVDAAGNMGVGDERCQAVPFDDASASVVYSGSATPASDPAAFLGTVTVIDGAGAQASLSFVGRKAGIFVRRDAASGHASIYLDGVLIRTVDLYSATTRNKVYVYTTSTTPGAHTVAIAWTGTKNASSSGTAIAVDGIAVIT